MIEIIQFLIEIIKNSGLFKNKSKEIILFLLIILLVLSIFQLIKKIIAKKNKSILNNDLYSFFTPEDIERATKHFISPKYQTENPSDIVLKKKVYSLKRKKKLIPVLMNNDFKKNKHNQKFIIVLGESGIGKTSFLINFYLTYKKKKNRLFSNFIYDILFIPLGYKNYEELIKEVRHKRNTILLLDAFDEEINAQEDYQQRLNYIINLVSDFRNIIITCRTQFFPSLDQEPKETGVYSFGENGEYNFNKYYLSNFTRNDINKYIRKRFSIFNVIKFYKIKKVVKHAENLLSLPMLLYHIDELIDNIKNYKFSYQIYELLLNSWFNRESIKPGIKETFGSNENFKKLLKEFSSALALYILSKIKEKGFFITENDKNIMKKISAFSKIPYIEMQKLENIRWKNKSLLNRNAKGQYKFSHSSIFEFIIAKEIIKNYNIYNKNSIFQLSNTTKFIKENITNYLNKWHGYFSTDNENHIILKKLTLENFDQVKEIIVYYDTPFELVYFNYFGKLNNLYVRNIQKMKYLYMLENLLFSYDMINNISMDHIDVLEEDKRRSNNLAESFKNHCDSNHVDPFSILKERWENLPATIQSFLQRKIRQRHIISNNGFYRGFEIYQMLKNIVLGESLYIKKIENIHNYLEDNYVKKLDEYLNYNLVF